LKFFPGRVPAEKDCRTGRTEKINSFRLLTYCPVELIFFFKTGGNCKKSLFYFLFFLK